MKKYIISLISLVSTNAFAQTILKATSGSVIYVSNAASLQINGGFVLDDNSSLTNDGTVALAGTGAITSNFIDNTTTPYTYGIGKFIFTGTGLQNINSVNQFKQIDVDNIGLNLLSTINASTWYLKTGKINTNSFTAFATSVTANAIQADVTNTNFTNSWVNGNLKRMIAPATVNNYVFPVGDATKPNIAELDNLIANPLVGVNNVTASFGTKPGNDVGLNVVENGTAYTSVNTGGVWYLVPNALPTGGTYNLKLFFNGFTGLVDNKFGILRRPDASSTAIDWMVPIGSSLPAINALGRLVTDGYAKRNNLSTFSQFGIASSLTALPLNLLNFTGVKKDKTVLLQWTTANENNISHFEIYKGPTATAFQYLNKVVAKGNTTTNTAYQLIDFNPYDGSNFYQLKMFDKNNNYKLSQIVKIDFDKTEQLKIYPNPVTNNTFFVEYIGSKINTVNVFAINGAKINCTIIKESNSKIKITLPITLAKGTYTVQVNADNKITNTKIEVQ